MSLRTPISSGTIGRVTWGTLLVLAIGLVAFVAALLDAPGRSRPHD